MNEQDPNPQLDALFALARAHRPDTSAAEFAFETRLMARVRARRDADSAWALVSWRLIPFFGACVVGLFFWQSELALESNDAASIASLNNPEAAEVWGN